jgi:hypothetical protein
VMSAVAVIPGAFRNCRTASRSSASMHSLRRVLTTYTRDSHRGLH